MYVFRDLMQGAASPPNYLPYSGISLIRYVWGMNRIAGIAMLASLVLILRKGAWVLVLHAGACRSRTCTYLPMK